MSQMQCTLPCCCNTWHPPPVRSSDGFCYLPSFNLYSAILQELPSSSVPVGVRQTKPALDGKTVEATMKKYQRPDVWGIGIVPKVLGLMLEVGFRVEEDDTQHEQAFEVIPIGRVIDVEPSSQPGQLIFRVFRYSKHLSEEKPNKDIFDFNLPYDRFR